MEFEQTQSIVTRIRQILEEYKYGDTVLLELLQNADDAGASKVEIMLDEAPTSPALMFYNDSIFTERDLQNIQHIGGTEASSKRHDAQKVGRFGLGFNSSFHLSDVVAFASGTTIVCFDPTKTNLPKRLDGRAVGGLRWDFMTHKCETPEEAAFFESLLAAFESAPVGFSRKAPFKGTLFRFALRQAPSALWREVHTAEEVLQLLIEFQACARLGLVLLKNVRAISVAAAASRGGQLYRVEARSGANGKETRDSVVKWLADYTVVMQGISKNNLAMTAAQEVEVQRTLPKPVALSTTVVVALSEGSSTSTSTTEFSVHHQLGPGDGWAGTMCWKLAEEAARYHHPIAVPWGASIVENGKPCADGRLVCFFPIRRATGFPLHLHGYFELSSDRQSIKDSTISRWNGAMCTEVVPFAYRTAVLSLCAQRKPSYGLWPHGKFVEQSLNTIAERTVKLLGRAKCIATSKKGVFETPEETIFAIPLSIAAHVVVAESMAIASVIDPGNAKELGLLGGVHETLLAHGVPHTIANPFIYREALSRTTATTAGRMSATVGEELLCRCTDDEDFKAFLEYATTLAVIPMHSGVTSVLRPPTSTDDSGSGGGLLMATDDATHRLCAQFPFQQRLVKSFHDAETPQGITCRKRLEGLLAAGALALLDDKRVFQEIQRVVVRPVLELGHDGWLLVLDSAPRATATATSKVRWSALVAFWSQLPAASVAMFAALPLLPAAAAAAAKTPARALLSVKADVCVACDEAPLRPVVDALVELGAREVDTALLPIDILRAWKAAPSSVSVIGAKSSPEALAVINSLVTRPGPAAAKALEFLKQERVAELMLQFLLANHKALSVEDVGSLAALPIFPDLWGSRIALRTTSAASDRRVFAVPSTVAPELLDALRLLTPNCGALAGVDLIDQRSALGDVPISLFGIAVLTELTVKALALPMLPPPPPGSPSNPDEASIAAAWRQFVHQLSLLSQNKGEVTPLLKAAIEALAAHEWVAPLLIAHDGGDVRLAPRQCVLPSKLSDEMTMLVLHLEKVTSASATPLPVRLPNLNFLAPLDAEHIERGLAMLGVAVTIDGDNLVQLAQAFDRVVNITSSSGPRGLSSDDMLIVHAATLTRAIESSRELTLDSQWATLRSLRFVPALVSSSAAPASSCGVLKPTECTLQESFNICPVGFKRLILPSFCEAQSKGANRGLHQCTNRFAWDAPPPLKAIVAYLDWCATAPDRAEVVRVAKGVWVTYGYLEKKIARGEFASADDKKLIESLKTLYFHEREVAVPVTQLSMNAQAQRVEPYLSCVDRAMQSAFPELIKALRIPEKHSEATILATLKEIAAKETAEKARLSERGCQLYAAALDYLVSDATGDGGSSSSGALASLAKTILVPTSDGGMAPAANVAYDFFNVSDQGGAADVLHSCVSAKVARALGMSHTGKRYLKDNNAKYSGAFRARGQRQSLTNAIKRILADYADVQSVLMEMLQNADDAGASDIHFYLDVREFAKDEEGLLGAGMQRCQGPALVVTNDKYFTRGDFDALMEVGCGHKKNDKMAIGRFGVGFNSVYHVCDCPTIVSGHNTVFLDPSAAHLSFATPDAPGLMIEHTAEPMLTHHFPGQFAPYKLYGVDFTKNYRGTLFRLPLRAEPVASSLSERHWSPNNIRQLFDDFAQQMPSLLLFLKNVTSVTLSEISPMGEQVLFKKCKLGNRAQVEDFRMEVMNYVAVQHPDKPPSPPHVASCRADVLISSPSATVARPWLLTTVVHSPHGAPDVGAPSDVRKKLLPWSSCAIPLTDDGSFMAPLKPNEALLFCFLPMPVRTGLPFHLHGSFALSSDRRGMWTDSLGSSESWEVKWNKFILESVAPTAVAKTICNSWRLNDDRDAATYYAAWPTPKVGVSEIHAMLGNRFVDLLVEDGAVESLWCAVQRCFVPYDRACFTVSASGGGGGPMKLSTGGAAPDSGKAKSLTTEVAQIVLNDEKLVCVPQVVFDSFLQAAERLGKPKPDDLSPPKVSRVLAARVAASTTASVPFEAVFPRFPHPSMRVAFMAEIANFCTSAGDLNLDGVPLLLLRDNTLGIVKRGKHLFVNPDCANDVDAIVPAVSGCVLEADFFRQLSRWRGPALQDALDRCGVAKLQPENLALLLSAHAIHFIPLDSLGCRMLWSGRSSDPLCRWLLAVWRFLYDKATKVDSELLDKCGQLAKYPLIPARRGPERVLIPLSDAKLVVSGTADPTVQEALTLLGVWTIDDSFPEIKRIRTLCSIADVEGQNLGELMESAKSSGRFDTLTGEQRPQLLKWLLRVNDNNKGLGSKLGSWFGRDTTGTGPLVPTIRSLPIFERYNPTSRTFEWAPLSADAAVLPDDVPLSTVCAGLYREACAEIQLQPMSKVQFFATRVLPALNQDDCPLTMAEIMNHLRMLGRDRALLSGCVTTLQKTKFIPAERQQISVAELAKRTKSRKESLTLRSILINRVSAWQIPYEKQLPEKYNHLRLAISAMELERLDVKKRYFPTECVRPLVCPEAVIPTCIASLLEGVGDSTKHLVPTILWSDWTIRSVLVEAGVSESVPIDTIIDAANVFTRLGHSAALSAEFFGRTGMARSTVRERREYLYNLGVSLAQLAQSMADKDALKKLGEIEFLLPLSTIADHNMPLAFTDSGKSTVAGASAATAGAGAEWHFFKPADMCPYEKRFLCWTQRPLMDPILDGEFGAAQVTLPIDDIVAHLNVVCIKQGSLPTELVDRALDEVYKHLVTHCVNDIAKCGALSTTQCLALPRESGEKVRLLTTLSRVIRVPALGDMRPHFFQPNDFSPEVATLIRHLKAPGIPSFKDVLQVLVSSAAPLYRVVADPALRVERLKVYIELLRLLIVAAENERLNIADPQGEAYTSINHLLLPLADGDMAPVPQATAADAPALLRRVRPDALRIVHPLVTFDLCASLGVPKMSTFVNETPKSTKPLGARPEFVSNLNLFFRTPTFARALQRIIASEASSGGGATMQLSGVGGGGAGGGAAGARARRGQASGGFSTRHRERLSSLRVQVVSAISVCIVDSRAPDVDISTSASSPISSCDFATNTIFIATNNSSSSSSSSKGAAVTFAIEPHYLVAMEIAKLLENSVRNLAPLCAILQTAMNAGPAGFLDVQQQLDLFGCVDICSANGAPLAGAVIDERELMMFGKCPMPRSCSLLPSAIPALIGRVEAKESGLVKWGRPELPLVPSTCAGQVVLMPRCLSAAASAGV